MGRCGGACGRRRGRVGADRALGAVDVPACRGVALRVSHGLLLAVSGAALLLCGVALGVGLAIIAAMVAAQDWIES